jgi:hypothetical protein
VVDVLMIWMESVVLDINIAEGGIVNMDML